VEETAVQLVFKRPDVARHRRVFRAEPLGCGRKRYAGTGLFDAPKGVLKFIGETPFGRGALRVTRVQPPLPIGYPPGGPKPMRGEGCLMRQRAPQHTGETPFGGGVRYA
jgi:hypothetical protein